MQPLPARQGFAAAALAAAVAAAFALRALGLELVFVGGGRVVFLGWDSYYHARRALWSFLHFPAVLQFDRYLNFPDGAVVPWPPLYTLLLAGLGRLLAGDEAGFERVVAWAPPAIGALTVLPVYAATRAVAGRGVALVAAWLVAVLPASVLATGVGNCDHQGIIALLGAMLLALSLHALRADAGAGRLVLLFAGLVVVRGALLGTWHGSLLYFGVADGALVLVAALAGRHRVLRAEAVSAAATALLLAPFAAIARTPMGGPFSAVEPSWLHVAAFAALAAVSGGAAWLERSRPAPAPARRLARLAALAAGAAVVVLAFPGPRAGLAPALSFVGKVDTYGSRNLEQVGLFLGLDGRFSAAGAMLFFGYFAFLLGVAPFAALARARDARVREPARLLALWSAIFALLAVRQLRYVWDFAPSAAVALALLLAALRDRVDERLGRPRLATALTAVLALLLLAPPLRLLHAPRLLSTAHFLAGRLPPRLDRALHTPEGTVVRFAERVRASTPDSAGYLDAGEPGYGIVSYPGLGHVLHYVAHRATPADNFGPYIGEANFAAAESLLELESEESAVAELDRMRLRYVATHESSAPRRPILLDRLHRDDGLAREDAPRLERLRLVTEGPRGGYPVAQTLGTQTDRRAPAYKLFERVEGAVLEVSAPPGHHVTAQVELETPIGRRLVHRAEATAGPDGRARLRVPYATEPRQPTRALAPYRVWAGSREALVPVSEDDVVLGATHAVDLHP
jgi:dolichyl-diphosphooligosaccharide--protein glycosyltransferase